MHQPRPFGLHGYGQGEDDASAIEALARRLTNLKELSGVGSVRMARTLPSGAIAIAQDMGGIFKVIVQQHSAEPQEQLQADGLAKNFIPMLFSGVIDKGMVLPGKGVAVKLSGDTRKRLSGYDAEKLAAVPLTAELRRFSIALPVRFAELLPHPHPAALTFTQYENLRPTWYSGAMAEVVQVVGGYGRQDFKNLPDMPLERARYEMPAQLLSAIELELGSIRLPGYSGLPPKDGAIRYDYKFNETNVVGFDNQRKPWLLRISVSGVHAMPLPLIPATTTEAFRRYVEEKQDAELVWLLNRFGGMPSGESFPPLQEDFQAWRRAGVIVKVCDVGDFYKHLMYGSAMGWSMNSKGTEGFNTCFDYDEDTQISYGYGYKLRLQLGASKNDGRLPESFDLGDPAEARTLDGYLSALYRHLPVNTAKATAIKYKLRRVPVATILERASRVVWKNAQLEVDHWDNLELEPIAVHNGNVSRVSEGPIGAWMNGFKFPEPFLGGCISFESPAPPKPGHAVKKADTIIAGYYVGDQLKVVKYFHDDVEFQRDVESNFEPCMIVGSWEQVVTEGSASLLGNYYTSDFDDREAGAGTYEVTRIVGTDKGYDRQPFFSFDEFFYRPGTLWRNRYFRHQTKKEKTVGYTRQVAVCMPYMDRNAVLHARMDAYASKAKSDQVNLWFITDPYTYRYWTYDFALAWRGGVEGPQAKVPVSPKDGNPVWVVQQKYSPGGCSDFADQGPWIPGLPADYTWLIHPEKNVWLFNGGGGPPSVHEYLISEALPGKTDGQMGFSSLAHAMTIKSVPDVNYFLASPDPYVGVFYRNAVKVAAGDCDYASVSEANLNMPGTRAFQGWSRLADNKTAHHFIGVINE